MGRICIITQNFMPISYTVTEIYVPEQLKIITADFDIPQTASKTRQSAMNAV